MKILIAYDGSKSSDAAIDDLARAGLPAAGSVLVVSISETWFPRDAAEGPDAHRESGETQTLAAYAKKRVQNLLPEWRVDAATGRGSPAAEILTAADRFSPDLIVIGPQGHSSVSLLSLGSISQKVLTEADTSVRIGRTRTIDKGAPARLIIAFDGSKGSFAAVDMAASRSWPAGSEIRLIAAAEQTVPPAIDRFVQPAPNIAEKVGRSNNLWLEDLAKKALTTLHPLGLSATFEIIAGNAKQVLIETAARWNADCIFLGANKHATTLPRTLGTTPPATAARAPSTVEVVRTKNPKPKP